VQEITMIRSRLLSVALALPMLSALAVAPAVHAQAAPAASVPQGDKAGRPPVEAAASQSGVATKKPAKSGTQSGPTSAQADAATAEKGNKATKPAVSQEAARSGVATKKPAKAGAQAGPASGPASAPAQ
jgi:hypothetical protein